MTGGRATPRPPRGESFEFALGQAIRLVRRVNELSLKHVAARAGLEVRTVLAIENGTLEPDPACVDRLATALEIRLVALVRIAELILTLTQQGSP
jgi:ribosome-binding protein aMBF1 (putative translation factor)